MPDAVAELAPRPHRLVEITVNKKDVRVQGPRATGLAIKEAAIAQGVQIQLDFQLAEIRGHERHIVGDAEEVRVHEHARFVATAGDDNS